MFSKKSMMLLTILIAFVSLVPSPISAANILFYSHTGNGAVGHIDSNGKWVMADNISGFGTDWTKIVTVD